MEYADLKKKLEEGFNSFDEYAKKANKHYNHYLKRQIKWLRSKKLGFVSFTFMSEEAFKCTAYCATVAGVGFVWDSIIRGHAATMYIPVFFAGAVLFKPFCEEMKGFKKDHPALSYIQWGVTSVLMCATHSVLQNLTLGFVNNILLTFGQGPALLGFFAPTFIIGFVLMSTVAEMQDLWKSVTTYKSSGQDKRDGQDVYTPMAPERGHRVAAKEAIRAADTPQASGVAVRKSNLFDSGIGSGTGVAAGCCKPKKEEGEKPIMCQLEIWVRDNVWPEIYNIKKSAALLQDAAPAEVAR